MAFYEHTIVGKQDLSEKEVDSLVTKYSKMIDKSGKLLKTGLREDFKNHLLDK